MQTAEEERSIKMMMMKAIWYSRHEPTEAQLTEASEMGFDIVEIPAGMELGSKAIESYRDVTYVIGKLVKLAKANRTIQVFGVFSTPILEHAARSADDTLTGVLSLGDTTPDNQAVLVFHTSWNITRTPLGGKPVFTHRKWCVVGEVSRTSLRLLA